MKSPEELQAAKRAMAERCEAIAKQEMEQHGVSVRHFRSRLGGRAFIKQREIEAPHPRTRRSLYVFLHEVAHIALRHRRGKPRHVEEMEAWKWAREAMRRHGIPVPRRSTQAAREHVAYKIHQAEARGAGHISPEARRFARGSRMADPSRWAGRTA
ncbi:MAG: hypothetical protein WBE06_07885 [Phycisphaerae bacterium]